MSDIRHDVVALPITTLIKDNLKNTLLFPSSTALCVTIDETAIEKWVGLTRRVIAIERAYHPDDKSLIRHVYDLNAIHQADKINDEFFVLAKDTVIKDAEQFKNQHPEYYMDPGKEIKQSLTLLKSGSQWSQRYQEFVETMVFNNNAALNYNEVMAIIEQISIKVLNTLN